VVDIAAGNTEWLLRLINDIWTWSECKPVEFRWSAWAPTWRR
jgi:hypothetical protein